MFTRLTWSEMSGQPSTKLVGDLVGVAHHRDGLDEVVVDQAGHLLPPAVAGQRLELRVEVAVAVQLEHRRIGRGGAVERELLADRLAGIGGARLVGAAGDHDGHADQLHVGDARPALAVPRSSAGA